MAPTLSSRLITILSLFVVLPSVCAHTVITYPGWRGNNLISNGTYNETDGLLGGPMNLYPGGMQWQYPCMMLPLTHHEAVTNRSTGGGLPTGTNRTKWPINGGALAFQPGWFEGHQFALIYINLGQGTEPGNWSLPMVPMFQVQGPSNNAYPDLGVCIPQIGLPANYGTPNVGDNATIQLVMAAQHGAALYSVSAAAAFVLCSI